MHYPQIKETAKKMRQKGTSLGEIAKNLEISKSTNKINSSHGKFTHHKSAKTIANQNKHDERRHNQMHDFCKTICAQLANPDEIAIFGPGTAKNELTMATTRKTARPLCNLLPANNLKGLNMASDNDAAGRRSSIIGAVAA